MSRTRAENLINKLISNKLSGKELTELLEGITDEDNQHNFSQALEAYFQQLLKENNPEEAPVSQETGKNTN
ncbi:hypothetical protein DYBT9275_00349 [Dyadobacter sp. CECT 9275]|uniref:Uncharacterized protein n=1 Tax=Dyadobacter helix TaxID=2822344 RepID=A0A916N438_9BACT|nr:hypothetical protein [Dyadobacter sp. CECT 9275]CAG4989700.1 hypothetical protein DYBT9275_00349 [Dyadobacter sp. CECT 9275]